MSKTQRTDNFFAQTTTMNDTDSLSGWLQLSTDLETELADKEKQLAEARARIDHLERIVDEMTEEQAALCAEGQSITELVAAKDKLIEQMREALKNECLNHCEERFSRDCPPNDCRDCKTKAASEATERGE